MVSARRKLGLYLTILMVCAVSFALGYASQVLGGGAPNPATPANASESSIQSEVAAPLLPAEETRFMLPHIEGVRQYGLILHPDDLLVNQNAAITHGFLYLNLTLRGVPDVNRSISLAYGECLSQERFIERSKRFGLLLVGIAALPVLVLAVGEVLRRMVLRVIGD
jgi:hypothetical protein